MPSDLVPSDYATWLTEVKTRIQSARSRAALAVNSEVVHLYYSIGRDIRDDGGKEQPPKGTKLKGAERLQYDITFVVER